MESLLCTRDHVKNLILIPHNYLWARYFYLHWRGEETEATGLPGTLWLLTIENYSGYCKQKGCCFCFLKEVTNESGSPGQECSWASRRAGSLIWVLLDPRQPLPAQLARPLSPTSFMRSLQRGVLLAGLISVIRQSTAPSIQPISV